ncbi:MAG: class I SAM-dependent methyltransferase [Candidatus Paceibacterota bacterium]|jgi:ubiquinone/menaquinone biosynthesis C-methylase UbiE
MSIDEQYDNGKMARDYASNSLVGKDVDLGRQFLKLGISNLDRSSLLIDVGCGSGIDLKTYEDLGFLNIYGTDPSEKMLEEAKNSATTTHLKKGTFESIPFEDKMFDVVVSRHALHYSNNIAKSLDEVRRILKSGGKFLAIVSHPHGDAVLGKDTNGYVNKTLFSGSVSITFPLHQLTEYFSEEFFKNFELEKISEYVGPEQDRETQGLPNTLAFIARKK